MNKYTQKTIDYINSIETASQRFEFTKTLNRAANRLARLKNFGRATKIDIRMDSQNKIVRAKKSGYVKNSTGEYVTRSYVKICHYKNVSYQPSVFECQIGIRDLWLKS